MADQDGDTGLSAPDAAPEQPPAPLLELRDPLPEVTATDEGLATAVGLLRAGTGPIAIDAERASGYRYSQRAYLIQLRREGAGTFLVDPVAGIDLAPLRDVLTSAEWILHAATQDLPCLGELGLRAPSLFDTELAARLLGYPRAGLATMVEEKLGRRLRKEHSAVDWSTRPLPRPWLEYAALDVEPLVELRELLRAELAEADKLTWAEQEFDHVLHQPPAPPRAEPWRRTSGLHRVRDRRVLAAVRALWVMRDEIAVERDVTPTRILPDSAIIAAAQARPRDRRSLIDTEGFVGRGARRHSAAWLEAIREAAELSEHELPERAARHDGPPPPRAWADRDPVAAARLKQARASLTALSEELDLPVENLLTPDSARRVIWEPPGSTVEEVAAALSDLGAREWQVERTAAPLAEAIAAHPG